MRHRREGNHPGKKQCNFEIFFHKESFRKMPKAKIFIRMKQRNNALSEAWQECGILPHAI
jgi:hypothetical protein